MIHSNPAADTESTTDPTAITMYSTTWCGDCRRARRAFADFGVPYREVNIEDDEDAAELVQTLNNGMRSVPTIVFPDGSVLVEPSNAALAAVLARYASSAN
jgi:mycoredoxin